MRKIIVRRKRQFAAALVPYWIVVGLPRAAFMEKYHLSDDTSCRMAGAYPLPRMDFDPQAYGQPILNGKTLEIEADDDATTVFAVTAEGLLSNELTLDEKEPFNKISIFEYCDVKNGADGFSNYRTNRIKDYQIEIWKDGEWETNQY